MTALDNDYPSCKSGEIYQSAQPTDPGGVEPSGLCYSQCKGGYTGTLTGLLPDLPRRFHRYRPVLPDQHEHIGQGHLHPLTRQLREHRARAARGAVLSAVSARPSSLAYAFDIGKYRFVQMHNYPTYDRTEIGIKSAVPWLENVLDDAKSKGKHAVLNYHDPDEHWRPTNAALNDALKGQDVVPIFASHYHWVWGKYDSVTVDGKQIPVYLSGSSEYNRFLLVEFGDDYFTVGVINASTGSPVFDSGNLTSTNLP